MPDILAEPRPASPDGLAARFRHFATTRTSTYAPLYAALGAGIADDRELLAIAAHGAAGQSPPDLMLAAVHYLLAAGPRHRLADFYPTLTRAPAAPDRAWPAFREFVLEHRADLKHLLATRTVQTNEVRRCTYLLPALQIAGQLAGGRQIALIEAGASAGLNLLIDHYTYQYGHTVIGNRARRLLLDTQPRGEYPPPVGLPIPHVRWRAGLDLHPLDPTDRDHQAWLAALVWADHPARLERLRVAMRIAAHTSSPHAYTGDATATLPQAIADAPPQMTVVVMHTAFLAHLPPRARERFEQLVPELSRQRPIYWIQAEPRRDPNEPRLRLSLAADGKIEATWRLAWYHPHGEWITWTGADPLELT